MILPKVISEKDLIKWSRVKGGLNFLTKCSKKVFDSEGNIKDKKFWWSYQVKSVQKFFKRNPETYGVKYDKKLKEVFLSPINQTIIPDEYLIHIGTVKNRKFNNIDNLSKKGLFGDPRPKAATYLSPLSKLTQPVLPIIGKGNRVMLLINKKALAKLRGIYIDPEVVVRVEYHDKIGNAFIVFGGIPEIAVQGLSFNVSGGKTLFTLRNGRQIKVNVNLWK